MSVSDHLNTVREWRALLREVPKYGWYERMAKALDAACDLIEELAPDADYHPRYQDEYARLWHGARAEVERLRAALAAAHEAMRRIRAVVDEQAEDEGLWGIYPMGEQPVVEAYLQQELRRLHAAVEGAALAASGGEE